MTAAALREKTSRARRASGAQLSDVAYQRIRQMIVECDLAPGAAVSQSQLLAATQLGMAAVRTALARLQQEGLVRPLPRRGYLVSPVTPQDINELLDLRLLLEPASLRLAVGRLTAGDLAGLRRLASVGYSSSSRDSERRFLRANRDFHLTIALCGGNGRLYRMLAQVLDEFARITFLTMGAVDESENWRLGHEAILDALARGDAAAAESSCRGELTAARGAMLSAVIASSGISRVNIARI